MAEGDFYLDQEAQEFKDLINGLTTAATRISAAENNIDSLNQSLANSVMSIAQVLSASLYNCTGTITGSISFRYTQDHKYACIWGRIRITNFSRTGSNPGVTLALPFHADATYMVGYRGESPIEIVSINLISGTLTTTESYSNATGNVLTLCCPITTFRVGNV